jgi:hypothetical protein
MLDPQIQDFRGRLTRIERIHRRGGGFEAAGTLGRSSYTRRVGRRSLLRPMFLVVSSALVAKSILIAQIGEADYQERVGRLSPGTQIEQVGAYVMQADPLTLWMSGYVRELLKAPL